VDWAIVLFRRFGDRETAAELVGIATKTELAAVNQYPKAIGRTEDDPFLTSLELKLGSDAYAAAVERGASVRPEDVPSFLYDAIDRMLASG
jgi:hypothetical protein